MSTENESHKSDEQLDQELRAELKEMSAEELSETQFVIRCIKQGWTYSEIARLLMAPVN